MHSLQTIKFQNAAADLRHAQEQAKASGRVCPSEAAIQEALRATHDKQAADRLARQSAHLSAQRSAGLPVSA